MDKLFKYECPDCGKKFTKEEAGKSTGEIDLGDSIAVFTIYTCPRCVCPVNVYDDDITEDSKLN
jgi:DNA-directed RNA polymerase subunit RPC12/RpoP